MSTINFANGTVIPADWLNEADAVVQDVFGAPATKAAAAGTLISGLTEDSSPATNDYVATYDTSATTGKKVSVSNLVVGAFPITDATAIIKGSADATKQVRFEVDGLTTATTRVVTVPDADITLSGTNVTNTFTADQTINGVTAGKGASSGALNTAFGVSALAANTTGNACTAVGANAAKANTSGDGQTAFGENVLQACTIGIDNTGVGSHALYALTGGRYNTGTGAGALYLTEGDGAGAGSYNTSSGANAMRLNVTGSHNSAFGYIALYNNTASNNAAFGDSALTANTSGSSNVAVGVDAARSNTTGSNNVAVGVSCLNGNTTGTGNTALGYQAAYTMSTAAQNTAAGYSALRAALGSSNTALGYAAMDTEDYVNCTCLGANTAVTGNNQVQLGDSATTTYVYGTVQNRSDARDKADIRPTALGLDFINALNPIDYRWDLREDYNERVEKISETGELIISEKKLKKDGAKKRGRFHHGLIAQEVEALVNASGIDFGGLQDHKKAGGQDVYSLGYDEFIAPLIKAVQELSAKNAELESRLAKAGIK